MIQHLMSTAPAALGALLLAALIIRKPLFGLVVITVFDAFGGILPQLTSFTSFAPLIGGLTLASAVLGRARSSSPLNYRLGPIYVLVAWFLFSNLLGQYLISGDRDRNFFFTYLQLGMLVWLVQVLVSDERELHTFVVGITVAVVICAIAGLVKYRSLGFPGGTGRYASGLSGNSNEFGMYSGVGVMLCFYLWQSAKGIRRFLVIGATVALVISVLLSGSRGAVVGLALTLFYILIRGDRSTRRWALLPVALGAAVLLFGVNLPQGLANRLLGIPAAIRQGTDTMGVRYTAWTEALRLWFQHPVFGIGSGMFPIYNQDYQLVPRHYGLVPHSMYLTILAENGLFGFLPFVGVILLTWLSLVRVARDAPRAPSLRYSALSWEAVLLFLCVTGAKASSQFAKPLWVVFGVALALNLMSADAWILELPPSGEETGPPDTVQ